MSKEKQTKMTTETIDMVVLVSDPILGSRYELQSVEVRVEESPETESTNEQ